MKQLFQAYETVVSGVWNSIFKGLRSSFKAENTGYIRFISFFQGSETLVVANFAAVLRSETKNEGQSREEKGFLWANVGIFYEIQGWAKVLFVILHS